MRIRHILCCALLVLNNYLWAQQYTTTIYKGESGLPSNITKSVCYDTLGFLWVATDDYLSRFNGYSFKHYNRNLISNYVKYVLCTQRGDLMVASDFGLSKIEYNADTAFVQTLVFGSTSPGDTAANVVVFPKYLMEDNQQRLWISEIQAISRYMNGKLKRFLFPDSEQSGSYYRSFSMAQSPRGQIVAISQRGNGFLFNEAQQQFIRIKNFEHLPAVWFAQFVSEYELWVGTEKGIFVLQLGSDYSVQASRNILPQLGTTAMVWENANTLLVSSWNDGVYRVKKMGNQYDIAKLQIPIKSILNMLKSNNAQIWCTADDGLYLLQPTMFVPNADKTPTQIYSRDIFQSKNNDIFSLHYNSIYRKPAHANEFELVYSQTDAYILNIVDYAGKFAFTTTNNELVITDFEKYKKIIALKTSTDVISEAYHITVDVDSNMWISQVLSGGILHVDKKGNTSYYRADKGLTAQALTTGLDRNNNLFAFAYFDTSYIFRYNRQQDRFENISIPLKFDHDSGFSIVDAATDRDNRWYLATSDGVIIYTDTSVNRFYTGIYTRYGTRALATDSLGSWWLANKDGVLHVINNNLLLFTERHGLASNTITWRGLLIDNQNHLWAASSSGLSHSLNEMPNTTPTPVFTQILVNNSSVFDSLAINQHSYMQINFACPTYLTDAMTYQYRIIERDTNWSVASQKNELLIPQMNVGSYTVQVRARLDGNYFWSGYIQKRFVVVYPWYIRWWALLIYILAAGSIVLLSIYWYNRNLLKQKWRLETLVSERTKQIQEQKNEIETTLNHLKQTQTQLVQSEKMASLGVLTAGIAHEINNPINFVSGNIVPLERDVRDLLQIITLYQQQKYEEAKELEQQLDFTFMVHEIQDLIQGIKTGASRTTEIVKSLRTFSRLDENVLKPAHLHENIEATLVMLHSQYRDRITITKDFDNRVTNINCFPGKLNQVFVNIINNAIQAIEGKGQITIATRFNDNNTVSIRIADTGKGIPDEVREHIFEPFFTTKDVGKGTGLGLSIALGIIEEHKGTITVKSKESEGSEFVITLPIKNN